MRAVSYLSPATRRPATGFLSTDDRIHGSAHPGSLQSAIQEGVDLRELGSAALAAPVELLPLDDAELLPAVLHPSSYRDFISFEQHLFRSRGGQPVPEVWHRQPIFYFSNPANFVGPRDGVERFPGTEQFDFELEIAAITGRELRNATPAEAEAAIVGYALLCDWSARDLQRQETSAGLGPAKGKDGTTTLGAILVTPDELAPLKTRTGFDLELTVSINGTRFGGGNWRDIRWSFGQMIAYACRGTRILPGDVFGSGTIPTGCITETQAFEPHPWLEDGDVVEIDAGPMGRMRAEVLPGADVVPLSEINEGAE